MSGKEDLPEHLRDKTDLVKRIVSSARRSKEDYDILFRWIIKQKKGLYSIKGFLDPETEYKSLYPTFQRRVIDLAISMDYMEDNKDKKGYNKFKNEILRLRVGKEKKSDKHPTLFIEKLTDKPLTY